MRVFPGLRWLPLVATLLVTLSAQARPLTLFNAMRDTPITRFNAADIDLMTQTVERTLDSGADGVTVTWNSPRTPSSGSVTPSPDPEGRKNCRLARIENRHRSLENAGTYLFCRSQGRANGAWQVIESAPGTRP